MSKASSYPSPKVLLVAEHASAIFGGEALIPFQYFKNLREAGLNVHLLVHQRTQKELLEAFRDDHERLHFVSDSAINVWCHRLGKCLPDRISGFTLGFISHLDTQIRQRHLVKSLLRDDRFDIIHEPIPVSPKLPSMLFGLTVPVIIGPMNGGMDYPPNYKTDTWFERFIVGLLRATSAFWNVVLPGKRQAALLLVANRRTYDALPENLKSKRVVEFVENGVDTNLFRPPPTSPGRSSLQIIHIGRLVDVKRVDLLLEACAHLIDKVDFQLALVGDGPLRQNLERQVQQLSLKNHVRFHGRLPQSAAADLLRGSDVMVFPSMRECGGAVVLEAMACGVAVIAARWGGPEDYVAEDTGVLIPPATPHQFVDELANAMLWMARNAQARAKMGEAGRRRAVAHYDWGGKTEALLKIYQGVLAFGRQPQQALK